MPKRSVLEKEFMAHVCRRIDRYIREQGLTDVEAARDLGVRKQSIRPYRTGMTMPGTHVLARACTVWGLAFEYRGMAIGATALKSSRKKISVVTQQLGIPFEEALDFRGVSGRGRGLGITVTLKRVS